MRTWCKFLLDKLTEVNRLLELITEEKKEEIKKYPIFRFYNDQSKSHEECNKKQRQLLLAKID